VNKESRWFTESDLEPLTPDQVLHLVISGVHGFDAMERTRQWQTSNKTQRHKPQYWNSDYDGCVECRNIAARLGLHGEA
jgi:hypothetical protein